uniref:(S)-ureidoglycine aminohydrolase cupin domain-containing protein n=1 Tax=Leersia perrieri TaxID=77586 RepID=A0A0D9VLW9_9ORYZ
MSPAAAAAGGSHLLLLPTTSRPCAPPPRRPSRGPAASGSSGRVSVVGRRPLEEVYKVRVERGAAAAARAEALRVMETWSTWRTGGRCRVPWDWQVDQLVYIVSGEVRVLPAEATTGEEYMHFVAGDLVRYPKWFEADLYFDGPYEERYRFLAYGDDN